MKRKMNDIFGIDKFNIIADEDNYYFFRALNNGDNDDINNGVITENGRITSIRTDRARFIENPENVDTRYSENELISLLQVYDHIKMHNRKDTNCISLSSNANVSLVYGRGNYLDQYVMIRVPKTEMGGRVFNAGEYMLAEIEKRIESVISSLSIEDPVLEQIKRIDNAKSTQEIIKIIEQEWKAKIPIDTTKAHLRNGIVYKAPNLRIGIFQLLSAEQSLEKDKIMQKLALLERTGKMEPIIPNALVDDRKENASSRMLAQTIGSAFSSCELIHYGEIEKENIINVPKEAVDAFSLVQQISESKEVSPELVEDLKQEIIAYIKSGNTLNLSGIENINIDIKPKEDISIEEMFELTGGSVSYGAAENAIKKTFYLAKSHLRANAIAQVIERITEGNPKYSELIAEIKRIGIAIEPEIITRQSRKGTRISESVNLDIYSTENSVIKEITQCSQEELLEIVRNGGATNSRNILQKAFADREFADDIQTFVNQENEDKIISQNSVMSKEEYYARAIIELYDFRKIGINSFKWYEKQNFIERLMKSDCEKTYKEIEKLDIPKSEISKMVLNIALRNDLYEEYKSKSGENVVTFLEERSEELKRELSISAIETFLGYYSVENTGLVLKDYQEMAVQKSDEIFEEKRFASIILPTGAGKTFVSLAKMLQHKDEPILYLAPTNEILEQVKSYIVTYCHGMKDTVGKSEEEIIREIFPNLTLSTYTALGKTKLGKDIIKKEYGFIVLDELHRTGAEEWGKALDELLKNQSEKTKVLGVTATPRRDVDGKDMSDEIALKLGYSEEEVKEDKHIAINIDLFTAIELGMVVNPKLVSCEYNLLADGTMEGLLSSINEIEDENLRKEKLAQFEKLRRQLENADGIEEILKSGLKAGGKYIVFLPVVGNENIEDEDGNPVGNDKKQNPQIEKYKKRINEYLKDSGLNPKFYSMLGSYGDQKNKKQLEAFESVKEDETTFMLVLNKANEGLHVKGVTGMLWFRPLDENSYILYMQQLGRVIRAEDILNPTKAEDRPIVFDFSNNTFRVNMNKKLKERDEVSDLNLLSVVVDWTKNHNGVIPNIDSSNKQEAKYAATLNRIQAKYISFVEEIEKYSQLEGAEREKVEKILKKGMEINLWDLELPKKTREEIDKILEIEEFSVTGIMRDFIELQDSLKGESRGQKSLKILKVLIENGVDIKTIKQSETIDGKNYSYKISELEQEGIDFQKIIQESSIDGNMTLARALGYVKDAYYGSNNVRELSEDEKREAIDLLGENFFRRTRNINLDILRCLVENDVDIKSIIASGQKSKRLVDIKQDGVDIEEIFDRNGFNKQKSLTELVKPLKRAYEGKKGHLEPEEIDEICEIFGEDFFEQKDNINVTRLRNLVERGVDIPKIIREHTTTKKICELEQENIDFRSISDELEIGDMSFGYIVQKIREAYNGKKGKLESEEREFVERVFGKEFFEEREEENIHLKTIRVLIENDIDVRSIPQSITVNGKRQRIKIKDIAHEGIDKIIEENELNGNKTLSDAFKSLRRAYNGTGSEVPLNDEERRTAEKLLGESFFEKEIVDENPHLRIVRILIENEVDIVKIGKSILEEGEQRRLKIVELQQDGIDFEKLVLENEIPPETVLSNELYYIRRMYHGNGTFKPFSDEEKKQAERLLGKEFFRRRLISDDIGKATLDAKVNQCDEAQRVLEKAVEQERNTNKRECESHGE